MKHENATAEPVFVPGEVRGRTAQFVRIGQRWQRKRDKLTFRIYNIHRHQGVVLLVAVNLHGHPKGTDITKVSFGALRAKYRHLVPDKIGGQG